MTTEEILRKMSRVAEQAAGEGIDPWNLPVKVLLKRYYKEGGCKAQEYNVLCLSTKLYNNIVITGADVPMSFKEFLMCMSVKSEEYYWYVHDVFGPPNPSSSNAHIMNMGYSFRGNKILIVAEVWVD